MINHKISLKMKKKILKVMISTNSFLVTCDNKRSEFSVFVLLTESCSVNIEQHLIRKYCTLYGTV